MVVDWKKLIGGTFSLAFEEGLAEFLIEEDYEVKLSDYAKGGLAFRAVECNLFYFLSALSLV